MIAVFIGAALIAFTVFAWLPGGLCWTQEIVNFLKGAAPVLSAIIGFIAILIGLADIKDRQEAKKEEEAAAKEAKKE